MRRHGPRARAIFTGTENKWSAGDDRHVVHMLRHVRSIAVCESEFLSRVPGRGAQTAPPAQSPDPCELAGDVAGRSLPTLQQNSTDTPDNGRGHPALRPGAWRGGAERVGEPGAPVAL